MVITTIPLISLSVFAALFIIASFIARFIAEVIVYADGKQARKTLQRPASKRTTSNAVQRYYTRNNNEYKGA